MTVMNAAKTLGQVSRWSLTQLTMQKTLYIAQMLHLGRTGLPLFAEKFEAWDKGPVVRELRAATYHYRREIVPDIFKVSPFEDDTSEQQAVVDAYELTRHMGVSQLINFTHRPGGAWEAYYREGYMGTTIPIDAIRAEWRSAFQPSDDALAWANQMADELATSPSRYLDSQNERAFRARVCGEVLQ